jgi:diguanylate cyclase (GGDEF)-like protein
MKFLSFLEKRNKLLILVVGFILIAAIGCLDFLTGYEISFSVFYVLPISLVTWLTSRRWGLIASFASALSWLSADLASGHPYSNHLIPIWNTFIRLTFFIIIASLLSALRNAYEQEHDLAHLDYLTGAMNSRNLYDLARVELDRFQRYKHPFTLAYLDIDNFKIMNDNFGHTSGDQILRLLVSCARKNIRSADSIARVGGDEFILFLPETNQESAQVALTKIHASLLKEMCQHHWPVTFSIGVLSCHTLAPSTTDELIMTVDELMYRVKNEGKNALLYAIYAG